MTMRDRRQTMRDECDVSIVWSVGIRYGTLEDLQRGKLCYGFVKVALSGGHGAPAEGGAYPGDASPVVAGEALFRHLTRVRRYVDTCSNTARLCLMPKPRIRKAGSSAPGMMTNNNQPRWFGPIW
jgi:hypothetical protein